MRISLHLVLLSVATALLAAKAFPAPETNQAKERITLSSQILGRIIDKQIRFFEISGNGGNHTNPELTRKAQEIVSDYEVYLGENPKDANALILYGKFLRKVGQEQHAVDYFLEADSVNPKLAVVKQQLANYLIEEGRPVDAFPFLIMTIELAPSQPDYHFHLGNFLFLFEEELVKEKIISKDRARSFMHKSFKQAAKFAPTNFDYQLRYAQSFFDFPDSSKEEALEVWDNLIRKFPDRSSTEKDYFKLCKARVLLELNRKSDALTLLNSVSSSTLDSAKQSLIHQVNRKAEKKKKNKEDGKQSNMEIDHRFFIPDDPHLERLKELTRRIKEEKMLTELKADVIKARFDEDGEIKIDLSQRANRPGSRNEESSLR
jgi:tetratricopeptide (TPR) repeat protein